jgi:MFS family permease
MAGFAIATNLIGFTIGPALAAFIFERFFEGPFAIAGGIVVISAVGVPVGGVSVWLARPRFRQAFDEATERDALASGRVAAETRPPPLETAPG